jgi:ABC-2 type transport system permease protein
MAFWFKPRSGTFVWLLAHDLRLSWRQLTELFARWSAPVAWAIALCGLAVMHAVAFAILSVGGLSAADFARVGGLPALVFGSLLWMISQGLLGATRSLYDGRDLDLLLGSPLPSWMIFTSRALAIAVAALGSMALLILPLAHMGALMQSPVWLMIYPLLIAQALIGTAVGLFAALALFFWVGPRRARLISQLAAAGIAGGFILAAQVAALLPDATRVWVATALANNSVTSTVDLAVLMAPFTAVAQGDLVAALWVLAVAGAAVALAVALLSVPFVAARQRAIGMPAVEARGDQAAAPVRFRSGIATVMRVKELRLIARDPNLFAQLGLQIIYTLPMAIVLLKGPHDVPAAIALAPLIVLITSQVTASLAWIAVSGEDAPELILTAPVTPIATGRAKLLAIARPVALIMALPVAALAMTELSAVPVTVVFAVLGGISAALLNFWHPMPGNRRGMLRRHSQSKVVAMAEHATALLWAVAVVLALVMPLAATVPVAMVVGLLWLASPKTKRAHAGAKLLHRTA